MMLFNFVLGQDLHGLNQKQNHCQPCKFQKMFKVNNRYFESFIALSYRKGDKILKMLLVCYKTDRYKIL